MPAIILALAIDIGLFVRVVLVASGDGFPLNDGGMFYAMIEDLKANSFRLPEYTSYNGGEIPYAYPALAFYLAAALSELACSTLDALIYIPIFFSVLTIPALYLLSRTLLGSSIQAALAALVFATIPRAFNWEIVGGGLTRAPGFFFAILALWQVHHAFAKERTVNLIWAGVLTSVAILFHPEMGWFVAFSTCLFVATLRRSLKGLFMATGLACLVTVLTAPWWLEGLLRLGPDPFISAAGTGAHSTASWLRILGFRFTEEPYLPLAAALGLLGTLASARRGEWLLPAWFVLIFILDPRKAGTTSTVPLAMLASVGLTEVILPLLRAGTEPSDQRLSRFGYATVAFALLVYAPFSTLTSSSAAMSPLIVLTPDQRHAMEWIRSNTPHESVFLVAPTATGWGWDAPQEWFPVLAQRTSITTVQGSEWVSNEVHRNLSRAHAQFKECSATPSVECIADGNVAFDYIYIPGQTSRPVAAESDGGWCCDALVASLDASSTFQKVFEGEGGVVYLRSGTASQ